MQKNLHHLTSSIIRAWQELTHGDLMISWSADFTHLEGGWDLPKQVLDAIAADANLDAELIEDATWWLLIPELGKGKTPILAAKAMHGGPWWDLLRTWQTLLGAVALEKHVSNDLATELVKAWDRLSFLYELIQIAGRYSSFFEMLQSIVESLSLVVPAAEVFLATDEPLERRIVMAANVIPTVPDEILALVRAQKRTLSSQDMIEMLGAPLPPPLEQREVIVAPISSSQSNCGILGFLDPDQGVFDAGDMQLLASVAEQIGALVEAAQARQNREEQERLARELATAAEIQRSLLPLRLPKVKSCQLTAYLRPAREVGGDFYDVAPSETGAAFVLLADVAGKGMPAALLTALVHATFHSEAPYHTDPASLLQTINQALYADLDKAQTFVTAAILKIEEDPLRINYASAGHADAIHWQDGQHNLRFLPATCLPLGVEQTLECRNEKTLLHPGDCFWLYSDGVTEAENPSAQTFGAGGLSDIIRAVHSANAEDQVGAVVEALEAYCWGLPLKDDIAFVTLRVQPEMLSSDQEVFPFVVPSRLPAIPQAVTWLRDHLTECVDSQEEKNAACGFALAFSEVLANQIEHAYGREQGLVIGVLTLEKQGWGVDLYDRGLTFEKRLGMPYRINPDDPPLHGYGLRLVQGLTDVCAYKRLSHGQNHWRLYLKRPERGE